MKSCARCGKHFARPTGLSSKQWNERAFCSRSCGATTRKVKDAEIVSLYLSGLSCSEIAPLVGLSAGYVGRLVKLNDVMRSASERQKLSHARPEVARKLSAAAVGRPCPQHVKDALKLRVGPRNHNWISGLTQSAQGYLIFTNSPANGVNAGRALHVVVAEWAEGRRIMDGEVVHHRDENKMNNHPDNLQIMNHNEHNRLHAIKNGLGLKNVG
jgi:hypothetical protein